MSSTQPLPPKKEVALALLERSSVYVHLDPRQNSVVVPPWFKRQPQLVLQIGLNMPMPIPDLRLDDDGLSCTLSFNRAPFFCVVPWASVFAMVGEDGRGMVWPDDVPAEVARQAQVRAVDSTVRKETPSRPTGADKDGKAEAAKPKRPRKRTPLAAVPDGDAQGTAGTVGTAAAQSAREREQGKKAKPRAPEAERGAQGQGTQGQVGQGASPRPGSTPQPLVRPTPAGARKKRELPPYLRVVK